MADDELTEQLMDLLLYAPLGFALDAKDLIPKLAERGRGQVALTRLAGRVAARQGRADPSSIVGEIRSAINVILGTDCAGPSSPSEAVAASATGMDSPIDAYATLTAAEIIPLLSGLSPAELERIGAIERGGRNRSTILNRLDQLSN